MSSTMTEPAASSHTEHHLKDSDQEFDPSEVSYIPTTGVRKVFETPLVLATPETIKGYGEIVDLPDKQKIEIVRWPAQGWRRVDDNSGDQGGVAEGIFEFWWKGNTLYARNSAVGSSYLFGWSQFPEDAAIDGPPRPRERALIWRANYHPDGGQMFFPTNGESFVVPLAMPGDDVTPEKFVSFICDGGKGLYIHPNIWHGAVVPVEDHARLIDRQGRVHARVSVNFAKEFGGYLSVPLHTVK
jgi:ureidoglycolate lyase